MKRQSNALMTQKNANENVKGIILDCKKHKITLRFDAYHKAFNGISHAVLMLFTRRRGVSHTPNSLKRAYAIRPYVDYQRVTQNAEYGRICDQGNGWLKINDSRKS